MKRSVLSMALSGLLATAAFGVAGDANAMAVHVNGDRIFLSGDVTLADIMALPAMLAKAEAEGRPFREVVLRTSNGGALISGEWLQAVIRTAGLNTIVSGRCISSCSIMQSGGVERYMAGDLPTEVDSVQIHAASSGGRVTYGPSPRMFGIYAGNYGGGMDEELLYKALFQVTQPNGLLVFADPARTNGDSVSFDPDGTGRAEETFPGQDMFNNNIMTSADYNNPGDTLRVTSNVTGDINPGYLRTGRLLQALVDDDFARWTDADYGTTYINLAVTLYNLAQDGPNGIGQFSLQDYLSDPGIQALLRSKLRLDQLDSSALADSAGVISIGNGAVWRTAATTGADLMRVDNGAIVLEGGALRTTELRVQRDGALVGHGDIGSATIDSNAMLGITGPSWREDGFSRVVINGLLMPRGGDLTTHGYVNIQPGSLVAFDVTEAGGAAAGRLRVGGFFDDGMNEGALVVAPGAQLALNVAEGFYGADYTRELIDGPIYMAGAYKGFQQVARLGDDAYSASIVDGEVFRPRHNSLLSFNVHQSADGLWLTANTGFEQTGLFANTQSGDGLGRALAAAANSGRAGMKPLLGALQFSDRDVIRQQAGALRGDAHATLQLADAALVDSIGSVIQHHQFDMRSNGGDADGLAARAAQAASAQPGTGNSSLFSQLAMHLVEPAANGEGEGGMQGGDSRRGVGIWGRGFSTQDRIKAQGDVAGMKQNIGGIVIGADTRVADDKVALGVSVAAADMSAKGRDGSDFHGDVRALDIGGYLDAAYAKGYVAASVRYTDLSHDTRRGIAGIEGLDAPLRAKYDSDALSARLEHGLSFTTAGGTVVQPLLPVVDYTRLSNARFNEGQAVGALTGRSGSLESVRVGAGLQLFKSFHGSNGERITPHARVLWQQELGDSQARFTSAFAAAPDLTFGAASQDVGEQLLSWNLGVSSRASERLSVMFDYVGERRNGQTVNGVMLGVGYRF